MPEEVFETPHPVAEPKPTNWPKIILVAVLGFGLLASSAYAGYYYGTQQVQQPEKPTPVVSQPTPTSEPLFEPKPTPTSIPTPKPSANLKTYTNEEYRFNFSYPQGWVATTLLGEDSPGPGVSFSNIADGHTIRITVWRVTGFGYCYKYGERKEIVVGGKIAETADGVGSTELCSEPEKYLNRGNTFVLIPLEESGGGLPSNQIHISYDYLLSDIGIAKSNLDQILSTFRFLD